MKPYSKYKASGVEWIGDIPENWYLSKLKRMVEVKDGTHDTPNYLPENGVPFITTKDIVNGRVSFDNCKLISHEDYLDINRRSNVIKGDIIMPMIGTIGSPIIVNTDIPFSIKNLALIKSNPNNDIRFICYFLDSKITNYQFEINTSGGVQNFVSLGTLRNLITFHIPIPEQTAIANFLDRKTAELDTLIANKKSLIELLKEERTAIINHAITKGINPNVKYKDSGIEWIGEIPEHWEVILLKRIVTKIKDGTHGTFQRVNEGYPFLSAKNVYNDGIRISETESLISYEDFIEITKNGFPQKNDLLITCVGTIGRTYVYDLDISHAFQRSVAFIRFNKDINPHYYKYYVESSFYQNLLISLAKTSAQSGVYMGDLMNTTTLKLPISEQNEITNYLNIKTTEIDTIISQTEKEIELLKEYKTALISEVVLGKVDVREVELV